MVFLQRRLSEAENAPWGMERKLDTGKLQQLAQPGEQSQGGTIYVRV